MKAVRIHSHRGLDALAYEDAPRPEPGPGEVLVRVHAAAVNPVDWRISDGYAKEVFRHRLPLVLGWDVAGTIEEVGIDATRFGRGDGVFGYTSLMRDGAYAEWMVAQDSEIAPAPASLELTHAAALPVATLTAWQSLFDTAGLSKGQTVLVHAAAGGVGSMAVQLAAWKGAKVIGTASARNLDFVRGLGASTVIDYTKTRFETVVRDADVVFDTLGGEVQERSWGVLKRGGVLVSIVDEPSEERAMQHGVRASHVRVLPNSTQLAEIARLVDAGKLAPQVDRVLPLSQARQAHVQSRAGHTRGKILLVPGS